MSEPQPLSVLCELTYRCNLRCPYCYNPRNLSAYRDELDIETWTRVVDEAADLGVLQLHVSGGEPTLRPEIALGIVRGARRHSLYTNLITQGTFLEDDLLDAFIDAGLEHIQISLQAAEPALANEIAGARVYDKKMDAIQRVLSRKIACTLNVVLHRTNHDTLADTIDLAERLGVKRLELANTQFYGWAYTNRAWLMPTREQVRSGAQIVARAQERLKGRMQISYVLPDYYEDFPKPCMHGWASTFITVAPNGDVLPCPAAAEIKTLQFENVRSRPLREIWESSGAFMAYRGTTWMREPCRSCERREIDFGGCRCQAFNLLGDAGETDPVCVKSPLHSKVQDALIDITSQDFTPRRNVTPTEA